jgi:hypothetical protein
VAVVPSVIAPAAMSAVAITTRRSPPADLVFVLFVMFSSIRTGLNQEPNSNRNLIPCR